MSPEGPGGAARTYGAETQTKEREEAGRNVGEGRELIVHYEK